MPYSIARGKGCSPSKPWAVVKDTDGSVVACHASKETALAQIRALYAAEPALAKARANLQKHLPGQHSQQTHATGGGGASDTGAPKKRNKKDIASDDQRALELYESGKTWDQVAQEMGFANGGVARRAGKRHEERRKAGETDDTKKPDETPDKPKPVEQPKPPEIVDVVTPPRPMDGKDPSQQLVPTNDLQEAMATGRPYAPLTYEGRTERARQAEERLIEVRREFNATQELHRGEIDRRYEVEQRKRAEYDAELDERLKASPKRAGESDWQHTDRVKSEMRAEGKRRSDKGEDEIRDDLINEGVFTPAEAQRLRKAEADIGNVWEETRYQMRVDTAEVLLGGKLSREPRMVPDFNSPADPVTGRPRMKQETRTEYPDGLRGEPRQAPVFDDVYVLPDGRQIKHDDVFPRGAYEDMPSDEYNIIRTTAKWRMGLVEQRATRQELIDGDGDGKFNEAMKKQLARQQAVVDSPNTRIVVHAPVTALGGITSAGFKSQLATGRSKGYKNRDEREGFETGLLGVVHPPDDKSRGLIYGALHTGGVRHADAVGAEQYGEIGFVLRREVHQRSTWTEGDSLGFHHEFAPLTGTQTVFNGARIRGGVDAADTSKWGTSDDKFASDLSPTPRRSRGYREAQVHGGVSLADVEYVTIPKGTKIPETARKRLVKAGVKIVEYDPADASPGVDGTEMHYPKNGKPYEVPKYKQGDWGNLPLPSDKAFTFAVDLFKFRRRHINREPLESLPVSTSWMNPTVMVKHLAGKHDQASHSGKRHGGYRLSDVDNPKADASVSQESRDAAKAVRDAAMEIEPGMTADMIDLANAHGGQMEGLAFRVKSEKSLARKVEAEKQDFDGDAMKTAESMSDVVRYTMSFDERQYTDGTQAVLDDLNAKGYKTRTKNYWQSDDPYQGINVAVTHPNGTVFELQFHTPKSVVEKEKVHLIYDNYRTEPSKKRRWQMWQEMVGISNAIPVPPGNLLGIGELRSQTFKSMWKRATQW